MVFGLEVGAIVRMPLNPDWGEGQIQSIVGNRVTVNFMHRGKVVLVDQVDSLELLSSDNL